jgi:DNA-binding beta-propeller fold protein YncE
VRQSLRAWIPKLTIIFLVVANILLALLFAVVLFSDVIPEDYKKFLIGNHVYIPPLVSLLLAGWRLIQTRVKAELYPPSPSGRKILIRERTSSLIQRRKLVTVAAAVVLTVSAGGEFWALDKVCYPNPLTPEPLASEGIALSADERFLYLAGRENLNGIDVFTATPDGDPETTIGASYRRLTTIPLEGRPHGISRTHDNKYLYAVNFADERSDKGHVSVIALPAHEVIDTLEVGYSPRWIVVSPTGDRVYVSNVYGDGTQGSISVIDAKQHKVMQGQEIKNVNCPEGLGLSLDGSRLYVASQCGNGQDPLFVVDTQTGQRIAEVPGLAVGNAVLLSNDGKKAYVSRANFKYFDPASKNFGAPLSIIDTASNRIIKTFILQVSTAGLALTPDGKYLLATNGFQLSVIDTQTDELVTNLSLRGFGSNIVVRSDNTVFVEVPDRRRIVQFQLDKALAHWPCESVGRSGF